MCKVTLDESVPHTPLDFGILTGWYQASQNYAFNLAEQTSEDGNKIFLSWLANEKTLDEFADALSKEGQHGSIGVTAIIVVVSFIYLVVCVLGITMFVCVFVKKKEPKHRKSMEKSSASMDRSEDSNPNELNHSSSVIPLWIGIILIVLSLLLFLPFAVIHILSIGDVSSAMEFLVAERERVLNDATTLMRKVPQLLECMEVEMELAFPNAKEAFGSTTFQGTLMDNIEEISTKVKNALESDIALTDHTAIMDTYSLFETYKELCEEVSTTILTRLLEVALPSIRTKFDRDKETAKEAIAHGLESVKTFLADVARINANAEKFLREAQDTWSTNKAISQLVASLHVVVGFGLLVTAFLFLAYQIRHHATTLQVNRLGRHTKGVRNLAFVIYFVLAAMLLLYCLPILTIYNHFRHGLTLAGVCLSYFPLDSPSIFQNEGKAAAFNFVDRSWWKEGRVGCVLAGCSYNSDLVTPLNMSALVDIVNITENRLADELWTQSQPSTKDVERVWILLSELIRVMCRGSEKSLEARCERVAADLELLPSHEKVQQILEEDFAASVKNDTEKAVQSFAALKKATNNLRSPEWCAHFNHILAFVSDAICERLAVPSQGLWTSALVLWLSLLPGLLGVFLSTVRPLRKPALEDYQRLQSAAAVHHQYPSLLSSKNEQASRASQRPSSPEASSAQPASDAMRKPAESDRSAKHQMLHDESGRKKRSKQRRSTRPAGRRKNPTGQSNTTSTNSRIGVIGRTPSTGGTVEGGGEKYEYQSSLF